jgi:hypothetical protein
MTNTNRLKRRGMRFFSSWYSQCVRYYKVVLNSTMLKPIYTLCPKFVIGGERIMNPFLGRQNLWIV